MERKQFTFYRSFWDSIKLIKNKSDRLSALEGIISYALDGEERPMTDVANGIFQLIKPVLLAAARKSENSLARAKLKKAESKPLANEEQTVSKPLARGKQEQTVNKNEGEIEIELENELELELKKESYIPPISPKGEKQTVFDKFWQAYPKKIGKQDAEKAFKNVKVPIETLLEAIEKQKYSNQWTKDNGQYIPNPATWLRQGRWDDEVYVTATTTSGRMQVPKKYEGESILDELFPDS